MKLKSTLLTALALAMGAAGASAAAGDYWNDGTFSYYEVGDTGHEVEVKANTIKSGADIVIPSTVTHDGKQYDVVAIRNLGFKEASINSIVIPSSVKKIGNSAFKSSGVTTVTLNEGLTTIGDEAFRESSIKKIELPSTVTQVGNRAFMYCYHLEEMFFNSSYSGEIGESTFRYCEALTTIYLPDGVTNIKEYAFDQCKNLTSVHLPANLISIDVKAFSDCNLSTVTLPETLKVLNTHCFKNNSNLRSIEIPAGLTVIYTGAFAGCNLEEIKLKSFDPMSLTTLNSSNPSMPFNDDIFYSATLLVPSKTSLSVYSEHPFWGRFVMLDYYNITFTDNVYTYNLLSPETVELAGASYSSGVLPVRDHAIYNGVTYTVTAIADNAFKNTSLNIKSLILPETLTRIGESAFEGCPYLKSIRFPEESALTIGKNAFRNISIENLVIPAIDTIEEMAFYMCSSKTIEVNARYIGDQAFAHSTGVTQVKLGNNVRALGKEVFMGCVNVTDMRLGSSLEEVGDYCFSRNDALEGIIFPASIRKLGKGIFRNSYGPSTIYMLVEDPYQIDVTADPLSDWSRGGYATMHVPADSRDLYKNHPYWSNSFLSGRIGTINDTMYVDGIYFKKITFGPEGNTCESYLGNYIVPAEVNTFPSNFYASGVYYDVLGIGEYTFQESDITSMSIPGTCRYIGEGAFWWCEKLEKVTIAEGVETIGEEAFWYNTSLTSLNLPSTIVSIGDRAFGCSAIKRINLPANLTSLGEQAFYKMPLEVLSVEFTDPTAVNLGDDIFMNVDLSKAVLRVPGGTLDIFSATAPWSEFGTIEETPIFECGFETAEDVDMWTFEDGDGDGRIWRRIEPNYPHNGYAMGSESWVSGVGDFWADNTMISPMIEIPEGGAILSWYAAPRNYSYQEEHYQVYVNPTGSDDLAKFRFAFEETLGGLEEGEWAYREIELPAGQVRFYFRHETYGQYILLIDDVCVRVRQAVEPEVMPGDVNNDGDISVGDITALINVILSDESASEGNADVNNDGDISVGDITALINIMLSE